MGTLRNELQAQLPALQRQLAEADAENAQLREQGGALTAELQAARALARELGTRAGSVASTLPASPSHVAIAHGLWPASPPPAASTGQLWGTVSPMRLGFASLDPLAAASLDGALAAAARAGEVPMQRAKASHFTPIGIHMMYFCVRRGTYDGVQVQKL